MSHKLSIAEQVQIMLAKAETTTPEEAEMITRQVEKLMVRHGLTEAMLAAATPDAQKEQIIQRRFDFDSVFARGYAEMAVYVAEAFGTMKGLMGGAKNHWSAYIIGHESDVDRATVLINSLEIQARTAEAAWFKSFKQEHSWITYHEGWVERRSFYTNFGRGAARRIREETRVAVQEEAGPGNALVLVDRKSLVDEKVGEMYPKLRKGTTVRSGMSGSSAGYRAGREASIHRGVAGSSTAGALR